MAYTIHNHRLVGAPYLPSPNSGGALKPRFLVIHYTASGDGFDSAAYFARRAARVSAHLVIRRDGTMTQCVPFNMVAWHAGKSRWTDAGGRAVTNLNQHAIGIEIENWGPLQQSAAGWVSWSGALVDARLVTEARHKSGAPDCGWERYTSLQVRAATAAAQAICAAYGIAEIVGHDDIAPGRKSDPGPAWDMEGLRTRALAAERRVISSRAAATYPA